MRCCRRGSSSDWMGCDTSEKLMDGPKRDHQSRCKFNSLLPAPGLVESSGHPYLRVGLANDMLKNAGTDQGLNLQLGARKRLRLSGRPIAASRLTSCTPSFPSSATLRGHDARISGALAVEYVPLGHQ